MTESNMRKAFRTVTGMVKAIHASMHIGLPEKQAMSGDMKMSSNGNAQIVDVHTPAIITTIALNVGHGWRCLRLTNLQRIRKERGLTQKELANKSGINIRMVQHYEQGIKDINKASAITVYNLAKALMVEMATILELQEV